MQNDVGYAEKTLCIYFYVTLWNASILMKLFSTFGIVDIYREYQRYIDDFVILTIRIL